MNEKLHECGGTILTSLHCDGSGYEYQYCDKCRKITQCDYADNGECYAGYCSFQDECEAWLEE
jgi:hypothetical protein